LCSSLRADVYLNSWISSSLAFQRCQAPAKVPAAEIIPIPDLEIQEGNISTFGRKKRDEGNWRKEKDTSIQEALWNGATLVSCRPVFGARFTHLRP